MRLLLVAICYFALGSVLAQNFEGIIVYERVTDKGKVAIETYYFGDQKLRIDNVYYLEGKIQESSTVYFFDRYTNYKFKKTEKGFIKKEVLLDDSDRTYTTTSDTLTVLNYLCPTKTQMINVEDLYNIEISHTSWLADDLYFELPEDSQFEAYMLSHRDKRIVLRLEETFTPPEEYAVFSKGSRNVRRAIGIYPYKLDDSVFDVGYP